jgi:hypothetical protein
MEWALSGHVCFFVFVIVAHFTCEVITQERGNFQKLLHERVIGGMELIDTSKRVAMVMKAFTTKRFVISCNLFVSKTLVTSSLRFGDIQKLS